MTTKPIAWVMAGGTGGHIMPGLAVAETLTQQGWSIRWLGNPQKMEGKLVAQAGYDMVPVYFSGVRGKGWRDLVKAPFALIKACSTVWQAMSKQRPSVVLGMGGYVAMPGGLVSWLRGVPLVLHEQNAVAGMTNRLLAKIARVVMAGFPNAIAGAQVVGNPVRASLLQLKSPAQRYASHQGALKLLVVGGSLGAAALNKIVPAALALMPLSQRPVVIHQAGSQHIQALQLAYQQAQVDATCTAFIDDMASAMSQADLMICRAGAMTVAEVAAVGVAALFVPFPHAVDDHQTENANYLVKHDAAWLRQQTQLTPEWLSHWLSEHDRQSLVQVAIRAQSCAKTDAAQQIAAQCIAASGVHA
jgi:UDP-N-acetylglucosamine--N-acetylmuramyl-(pentapeptide) pyrophosphoryl-undecaprenol N-acetylglucosamine transferase